MSRTADAGTILTDDSGRRVQVMHNGLRVLAGEYGGEWTSQLIEDLQGVHEPQEETVFASLLGLFPESATMLEIGAFWSYYTLWFLSEAPRLRRGIALEPDPHNLSIGRQNCELNGLSIEYHNGFISAQDEAPSDFETENSGICKVEGLSISTIFERAGVDRADLILCDAQGGEIALLQGIEGLVRAGRIGVVLISTHSHHITGDPLTHQRALRMIEALGGVVRIEHDVHESFSGDGMIVADFGSALVGWEAPGVSRNRYSTSFYRNPLWDLASAQEDLASAQEQIRLRDSMLAQLKASRSWKLTRPLRWLDKQFRGLSGRVDRAAGSPSPTHGSSSAAP